MTEAESPKPQSKPVALIDPGENDPKRWRLFSTLSGSLLIVVVIAVVVVPILTDRSEPDHGMTAERVHQWADAIQVALEQYRTEHANTLTGISDGPVRDQLELLSIDPRVFLADFARPDGTMIDEIRLENVNAGLGDWTLVIRCERAGVAFRQSRGGTRAPIR